MRRGDFVTIALPGDFGKPRPALVIQADLFADHATATVLLVSSALARAEVTRALFPLGEQAVRRGQEVLAQLELIRVSDRILAAAGALLPAELRTLDAIHLASALQLGSDLARIVTYDERLRAAARSTGCATAAPR